MIHPPTMLFIGVTTGQSSSLRAFPGWAEVLGLGDAQLVGVDLALDASPAGYREVVERIKSTPHLRGALVTTHKLNVLRAARNLFDELTDDAQLCGEVGAIYKRPAADDEQLLGHAVDPTNAARAMQKFLPANLWRGDAQALLLGAGGAATAMIVNWLTHANLTHANLTHANDAAGQRPSHIVAVDHNPAQLDHLRKIIEQIPPSNTTVDLRHHEVAAQNDTLLAELPPRSLVINATGMGKDRPGSPLSDGARFPQDGLAWELNYRGALDFLQQARAQEKAKSLTVVDGWDYFLLGWSSVISLVFDIKISEAQFTRFAQVAEEMR